jgi:hypothetical protein
MMAGGAYAPARPLLHYLRKVLMSHGWTVQELWWQPPHTEWTFEPGDGRSAWVRGQIETALSAETARHILLAGKSLASFAIPVAAERRLPAIWLTPIFNDPANRLPLTARTLLVGGTADRSWDGEFARKGGQDVLELPGQDHGLEVDDPIEALETLRRIVIASDQFLATL